MKFKIILVLLLLISNSFEANLVGIDFGSNYISFGLLKSGKPIQVVRNENEKRITPALVTIRGNERYVGLSSVPKV